MPPKLGRPKKDYFRNDLTVARYEAQQIWRMARPSDGLGLPRMSSPRRTERAVMMLTPDEVALIDFVFQNTGFVERIAFMRHTLLRAISAQIAVAEVSEEWIIARAREEAAKEGTKEAPPPAAPVKPTPPPPRAKPPQAEPPPPSTPAGPPIPTIDALFSNVARSFGPQPLAADQIDDDDDSWTG